MPDKLPQNIVSRKDEITAAFPTEAARYVDDLVQGRSEQRLSTADFAAKLFIHPRHLTHTIKLSLGTSPCEILEEKIIEEARKMLAETTRPVADIAANFAYYNATNFIKFFKGYTGLTPLQYRKRAAAKY